MKSGLSFLMTLYAFFVFSNSPYEELVALYDQYGGEKYMIQEDITQRSHVLQAAYIAQQTGAPEELIVALLYHDIGQITQKEYLGQTNILHEVHDELGYRWLKERGFPDFVCDFVHLHTLAKIILCEDDPNYYQHLSEASRISYQIQQDKFSSKDGIETYHNLKKDPRIKYFLVGRKCDDMAKIVNFNCEENSSNPGQTLPDFASYKEMIARVHAGKGRPAMHPLWQKNIDTLHQKLCSSRPLFERLIRDKALSYSWKYEYPTPR